MSQNNEMSKVDFDEYSDNYEQLLRDQLSFFSGDRGYFSSYKIETIRELFPQPFKSILDFGSGIGLSLPHLVRLFPEAGISATDISKASLQHITEKFPEVTVLSDEVVHQNKFDLILVITVMHHVAPQLRGPLMNRLESMLTEGGKICIFEHNPYNPVTQRMVSTCPFDEDAVLLTRAQTKQLFYEHTKLKITRSGYTLFFPSQLAALRPVERYMTSLPLGGQYYVVAENSAS